MKPTGILDEKPTFLSVGTGVCIACFCLFGSLYSFLWELDFPGSLAVVAGGLGGLAFLTVVFLLPQRRQVLLGIGALFWIIMGLFLAEQITLGAFYAAEVCAAAYLHVTPDFSWFSLLELPELQRAFAVFAFFVSSLLGVYVAWAVLWMGSFWLCFLGTFPWFGFVCDLHGISASVPTIMVLSGWLALVIKGQAGKARPHASARISLATLAVSFLLIGFVLWFFPAAAYTVPDQVPQVRGQIDSAIDAVEMQLPFGSVRGTAPGAPLSSRHEDVDLTKVGDLKFSDSVALRVRGSAEDRYYLRGFSASEYTGQAWKQPGRGDFDPADYPYQPLTYVPLAESGVFYEPKGQIEIEMNTANPAYAYTPYLLSETTNAAIMGDAYFAPANPSDAYTAQYYTLGMPLEEYVNKLIWIPALVYSPLAEDKYYANVHMSDGTLVLSFEDRNTGAFIELYTELSGDVMMMAAQNADTEEMHYEFWRALNASHGPEGTFLFPDADYMAYIQETYTQLPEGLAGQLQDVISQVGVPPATSPLQWPSYGVAVADFIQNSGTYTLTPGQQPGDEDFVTYFLTESKRGYCIHFASAATAMLRALNVPARYVEGYVVNASSDDPREWVDVPAKNAHAWVEIWYPNIGWVPVEVTPGGGQAGPGQGVSAGQERPVQEEENTGASSSSAASDSQAVSQPRDASSLPPSASAESAASMPVWMRAVLGAGIFVLLIVILFSFRVVYTRKVRRRRIGQKDTNKAALAVWEYLEQLAGFGLPPTERAKTIAGKARFSQHRIDEEEISFMRKDARQARETLHRTLPRRKKAILFWRGL